MIDMSVPYYQVIMMCSDISGTVARRLPEGFHFVMCRPCYDDALAWAELETSVGEYKTIVDALSAFSRDFGAYPDEISKRILFVENEEGRKVGTSASWYGRLNGVLLPRFHFVAIHPEFQGKGIAKPMIMRSMEIFEELGETKNVFLISSTRNHKAIGIYQDIGFEPYLCNSVNYYNCAMKVENNPMAWQIIGEKVASYKKGLKPVFCN